MIDAQSESQNKREAISHQSNLGSQGSMQSTPDEFRSTLDITSNQSGADAGDVSQMRLFVKAPQADGEDGEVSGFGWMNEFCFYYGRYNQDEYILKKRSLEQAASLKKEGNQLTENVLPHSFAVTQFHIV